MSRIESLARNWSRLLPLFDMVDSFVFILAPGDVVQSCNQAAMEMLGVTSAQIAGRPASTIFRDEKKGLSALQQIAEGLNRHPMVDGKATLCSRNGASIPVSFHASILRDEHGENLATLIVAHDERGMRERDRELELLAKFPDEDPNPVLRVSPEGTLQYANRGSWLLLAHWGIGVGDRIPDEWRGIVERVLSRGEIEEVESEIAFKTLLLFVVPLVEMGYVNIYGLDVSRRRHVEEKLQLDAQVFESASEGIMITDPDARIIDVNHAFTVITGYTKEEILGENARILRSERHDEEFYRGMWRDLTQKQRWQGEIWDRRRNGEVYPKWLSISAVTDERGGVVRYIALFSDITSIKATQEQLYRMAHYDSLTGVPNRRFFQDLLEQTLQEAKRNDQPVAVMFVDLDGFKMINDNLGHAIGDQLLCSVAERIKDSVRNTDTVARMGGDEFTVVLPNLKGTENAGRIARKILSRIAEPIRLGERDLIITASIGIAIYPDDISDAESLMKSADTAMYSVKELGKNSYQFFSHDMNEKTLERLILHARMRQGLQRRQFFPRYQPQADAQTARIVAVEALARWKTDDGELIEPDQFIPLAEETGLINEIGIEILTMACKQGREWLDRGYPPIRMAVNVSGFQVRHPDFVALIEKTLDETGFPATLLELELTESVLISDTPDTHHKLDVLKSMGASFAIDDFGTRYSSLGYLRRFPIDRLKIDKSFVTVLPNDTGGMEIASAISAMARSLNLEVIAEGVETSKQAEILKGMGCRYLQGYWIGEPMEAEQLQSLISSKERLP